MGRRGLIAIDCIGCGSAAVTERPDRTAQGYRRFRCRDCGKQFKERSDGVLNRTSLPTDIIAFVVFCWLRCWLTLRDLSEIMLLRGFTVSHECVRQWEAKLLPAEGEALRKRHNGIEHNSGQLVCRDLPHPPAHIGAATCGGQAARRRSGGTLLPRHPARCLLRLISSAAPAANRRIADGRDHLPGWLSDPAMTICRSRKPNSSGSHHGGQGRKILRVHGFPDRHRSASTMMSLPVLSRFASYPARLAEPFGRIAWITHRRRQGG
jgi:hypothetical protein